MVNFNDYIEDTNNYVSKIKDSIYIEGNENSIHLKGKEDICEIIIAKFKLLSFDIWQFQNDSFFSKISKFW